MPIGESQRLDDNILWEEGALYRTIIWFASGSAPIVSEKRAKVQ